MVLEITLNFDSDAGYKEDRFFKILSKKSLKFVLSRGNSIVALDLGFIILLVEIDLIANKRSCKKYMLRTRDISCIEMIFILPTIIIAFHIGTFVI